MDMPTFETFAAQARRDGFNEVLERSWAPDERVPTHSHPFDARAVVVRGEMWLTVGDDIRRLGPGDRFELARDVAHDERHGPLGATYWVARRAG